MQILTLNRKKINWQLSGYELKPPENSKSQFQGRVGSILKEMFPHDMIVEEIPVPEDGMVLDFFVPAMKLVVECDGRQHGEHVKFFHKTPQEFAMSKARDAKKTEWCRINSIALVRITPEMGCDEVTKAIINR